MNAQAITQELEAAGAEMRDCCSRLDERDARRQVIATGKTAMLVGDDWVIADRLTAGFVGWAIKPSLYSRDGAQKWWINANGSHSTCKPAEPYAIGIAMSDWIAAGHTLD